MHESGYLASDISTVILIANHKANGAVTNIGLASYSVDDYASTSTSTSTSTSSTSTGTSATYPKPDTLLEIS